MSFLFYAKLYLLTIPIFLGIDAVWLGFIAKSFYKKNIGHLMAEEPFMPAAIIFYLIYIVGLLFFAVSPALEENNWQKAAMYGAALGALTYATYDFTNWATLKDWPVQVVLADVLWGTFLGASVSTAAYFIGIWLKS